MNFSDLFSTTYLLDKSPQDDFLWGFPLLAFFILLLFIGNLLKSSAKKNKYFKKSIRKKLWPFQVLGGIGSVLVLARFSEMDILSRPIFVISIFVITIIFAVIQFFRIRKEYLRRLTSAEREKLKKLQN